MSIDATKVFLHYIFQELPDLPVYLHEGKVGRTAHSEVPLGHKKVVGVFRKGCYDGRFNGWPDSWSLPSAPASVCYHQSKQAQNYLLHLYTVGYFMGAAESSFEAEVPDPADPGFHSALAEVS